MPDHKVHCEECGGFLNIRGVGSCHCSTNNKPDDEPKISPSVMEAAEAIEECLAANITGILHRSIGTTPDPAVDKQIKIGTIRSLILDYTHLTDKEAALRELMEATWEYRQKSYAYQISSITKEHYLIAVHALDSALTKAKKVMKL